MKATNFVSLVVLAGICVIFSFSSVEAQEIFKGFRDEYFGTEANIRFDLRVLKEDLPKSYDEVNIRVTGRIIHDDGASTINEMFKLKDLGNSYYVIAEPYIVKMEIGGDIEKLLFSVEGFYTFTFSEKVEGDQAITYTFSKEIDDYESEYVDNIPFGVISYRDNMIVTNKDIQGKIKDILESERSIYYRDFSHFSGNTNLVLGVNSFLNKITSFDRSGRKEDFTKQLKIKDPLDSPEGITTDRQGRIYITDWGNHRVAVFDKDGALVDVYGVMGEFGENTEVNTGAGVKLLFPARIAVEEPPAGSFKDRHILVADRNGVHKLDSRGHYLDSPIKAGENDFEKGEFYGIAITGYGDKAELYVINRNKNKILRITGTARN